MNYLSAPCNTFQLTCQGFPVFIGINFSPFLVIPLKKGIQIN